jgi:hypothetical protein
MIKGSMMNMDDKKTQLINIAGKDNVFENPETDEICPLKLSKLPRMAPHFKITPKDVDAVQKIVAWANETETALIPVSSGGPHYRGDTLPSAPQAVIVDLSGMNAIARIDRRNRLALIQPGVTFAQLIPELKQQGLKINMPLLPKQNKSVIASLLEREPVMAPRFQWSLMEPLRSLELVWGNGDKFYSGTGFLRGEDDDQVKAGIVPAQGVGAGPSQIDFYKFVSAAQGSMGIATWASVKCEILPKAEKVFFVSAERLEDLIDFTYKLTKFRFGDELFLINNHALSCIMAENEANIRSLKESLPMWTVVMNLAGGEYFPEERVEGLENDIKDIAQSFGLDMTPEIGGCMGYELLQRLQGASDEPYWKTRCKGSAEEIFFLTTLDKTPDFLGTMTFLANGHRFPASDIGVYIQPAHQGVSCHMEFILPVNRENRPEAERVKTLFEEASFGLFRKGAFFSRPYGTWADIMYNADAMSKDTIRKIKSIFDPNHIMNPGKLCF